MCAQLVVYPQRRPIFSTTLPGWLPVPYYTQQLPGQSNFYYWTRLEFDQVWLVRAGPPPTIENPVLYSHYCPIQLDMGPV